MSGCISYSGRRRMGSGAKPVRSGCAGAGRGGLAPHARARCGGFTLLEVLVSMAILALIVVACANLFGNTLQAWETGVDRTETVMTGRTITGFMADEIAQAVLDRGGTPRFEFAIAPSEITFVKLSAATADDQAVRRSAVRIKYTHDGLAQTTVTRQMDVWAGESYTNQPSWSNVTTDVIATNVFNLEFVTDPGYAAGDSLPLYVEVYLDTVHPSDVAKFNASGGGYGDGSIAKYFQTFQSRAYLVNRGRYE